MADFCTQCSVETFGEDFGDLANLTLPVHTSFRYYALVICEGCGPVYVDHTGRCVTNCLGKHSAPCRVPTSPVV